MPLYNWPTLDNNFCQTPLSKGNFITGPHGLLLNHWTKTSPMWTITRPGVDEKLLNFISIISSKIQVYYLKKCCEIFFHIQMLSHIFCRIYENKSRAWSKTCPVWTKNGPEETWPRTKTCPDWTKKSPSSNPYFWKPLTATLWETNAC